MKTAAKVFLIIGIVGAAMTILVCILGMTGVSSIIKNVIESVDAQSGAMMEGMLNIFYVSGIISGALGLLFGILALKKLGTATMKSELIPMGVCSLLFCNLLGGLFMLLVKDEDLARA